MRIWNADYGACYTLVANQSDLQGVPNPSNELSNISCQLPPYTELIVKLSASAAEVPTYSHRVGFIVLVHDEKVYPLMRQNGITIGTNTYATLYVTKVRGFLKFPRKKHPFQTIRRTEHYPPHKCDERERLMTKKNREKYTPQLCDLLRRQNITMQNCSCYDPLLPRHTINTTKYTSCTQLGQFCGITIVYDLR